MRLNELAGPPSELKGGEAIRSIQVYGFDVYNTIPMRSSGSALLPNHSNISQVPSDSQNNMSSSRTELQRPGGSPSYPRGQKVLTQSQSILD